MGKSTISMAIFNCKLLVHQRVPHFDEKQKIQTAANVAQQLVGLLKIAKAWIIMDPWPANL